MESLYQLINYEDQSGQSLVELLLAIGLLAIVIPAIGATFVASRQGKPQQQERVQAVMALEETQEAVRNIRESGWTNIATDGTYHPTILGSSWTLASGAETLDSSTGLSRQIVISGVYRNNSGVIVASSDPQAQLDPSTKKAVIVVSWSKPYASAIQSVSYLTRYLDNISFTDTTVADFNQGANSGTAVVTTSGSDGQVQLGAGGGSDWCNPNLSLSSVDLPGQGITTDISAIQGHAYTTTGGNASGDPIDGVVITDTNPPQASLDPKKYYSSEKTYAIFVDTNYVYLSTDHPGRTVDIIDPTTSPMTHKAYFSASGGGQGNSIYTKGGIGYVTAGEKLYTFDISSATQDGLVSLNGTGERVIVKGTRAYVATSNTTNQLQIFDVSNPSSPTLLQSISMGNGQAGVDVFVNDTQTYAYVVTSYASGKNDFFTVDLSGNTVIANAAYSTNGMNPKGVTVVPGNRAIIVGSGGEEYQVLNLATDLNGNPTTPTHCGGITLTNGASSINAITTVIENDADAYSYILTNDSSKEFQIIEGGPGGGLSSSGTYTSQPFNIGYSTAFYRFEATVSQPTNTSITMQVAAASLPGSGNCADAPYTFVGPNGDSTKFFTPSGNTISGTIPFGSYPPSYQNPAQCFEYKAFLSSTDQVNTPILYDVTIYRSP